MNYETYLEQLRQSSEDKDCALPQDYSNIKQAQSRPVKNTELKSHSATKGLFAHIQANNIKSLAVLAVFLLLLQVIQIAFMIMLVNVRSHESIKDLKTQTVMFSPSPGFRKFGAEENELSSFPLIRRPYNLEVVSSDLEKIWHTLVTKANLYKGWSLLIFIPAILHVICGMWFSSAFVKRQTGARRLQKHQEPRLFALVEKLTLARGLPMPAIEVIETNGRNAYASGFHPKNSAIGVTRGLLTSLNDAELEAVLAHEVAHIEGRDNRLMTFSKLCVGIISSSSRNLAETAYNHPIQLGLISVFIFIVAPLTQLILFLTLIFGAWGVAELVNSLISRKREFIADARAIEIMKSPAALISALRKVSANDYVSDLKPDVQAMMISNLSGSDTSTHPPIEARIRAIEETTSVNYADIQAISLQPIKSEWGGQLSTKHQPLDVSSTGFGKRTTSGSAVEIENQPFLEDPSKQGTYNLLMALDQGIGSSSKFLVKLNRYSFFAGLILAPIFLIVAIISALTGLSWPFAFGILVIAVFWWRRRKNKL